MAIFSFVIRNSSLVLLFKEYSMSATDATTTAAAPTRLFRYGEHTFDDPGPQHSPDAVRRHLSAYFPELGQATAQETTRPDGVVEITFRKQVTTKGSDSRVPA
jgi:PRTRC genetic system protein C